VQDLALTVAKLERKQRDTYDYKNVGISKQAAFLHELGDWLDDSLKTSLEAFGVAEGHHGRKVFG
jgi:hypothetical protein